MRIVDMLLQIGTYRNDIHLVGSTIGLRMT